MKLNNRDIILIVAVTALVATTIFLGYFVFKTEDKKESDLQVEEVYFVMERANSESSQIEIIVFISNVGNKDVEELKIRAFTVESGSNLAMDDSSTTINDVKQQTTVEGQLIVDVPNNDTYRMELLIFKDDKLEIRGSGTIDLTGIGTSYDYRNYPSYDSADGDDNVYGAPETAASFSGGFCIIIVVAGVVIGIIIYAVVKSRKPPKNDKGPQLKSGHPPNSRELKRIEPRLEDFEK